MTTKEVKKLFATHQEAVNNLISNIMPTIAGNIAIKHFKKNFDKGGFVNNGLKRWKPSKRIGRSESAEDNYRTLLSGRTHLYDNVNYTPGVGRVTIFNSVPYASIHNKGGTIPITTKMRKFGWAKYFEEAGITRGMSGEEKKKKREAATDNATRWLGLALTKKSNLTIAQRQFIGPSKELSEQLRARLDKELEKLDKQYFK